MEYIITLQEAEGDTALDESALEEMLSQINSKTSQKPKTLVVCEQMCHYAGLINTIGEGFVDMGFWAQNDDYILVHGLPIHCNYDLHTESGNEFARMPKGYNVMFNALVNREDVNKVVWLINKTTSFINAVIAYRRVTGISHVNECIAIAVYNSFYDVRMRELEAFESYINREISE